MRIGRILFSCTSLWVGLVSAQAMDVKPQPIRDAVFLFSGGYNSCGDKTFPASAAPLVLRLRQHGVRLSYVAACHDERARILYSSPALNIATKVGSFGEIRDAVIAEARKLKTDNIFLLGHSFGGNLIMTVGEMLPKSLGIRALVTMDPISPNLCNPLVVAESIVRQGAGFSGSPGCLDGPQDWSGKRSLALGSRLGWWLNYFQTRDAYIRSSEILGAENRWIIYGKEYASYSRAHREIDVDSRVWQEVNNRILMTFFPLLIQ